MPERLTDSANLDIQSRLAEVRATIESACARRGREPEEVTVVAITKGFPSEVISKACALGLSHIGENRVQELLDKFGDGRIAQVFPKTRLHLVGHLQSNKVRKALQWVWSVDSVDSVELAEAISRVATDMDRDVRILLEVNTSGEPQKFGFSPAEVTGAAGRILRLPRLQLGGLMTVGPLTDESDAVRDSFRSLRACFEEVRSRLNPPHWNALSMGVSGDYEIAVEEGATEVRIGTALFGPRRTT